MASQYGYLRVVQVCSDRGVSCNECGATFGGASSRYDEQINHFLDHGWEILTTGSEGSPHPAEGSRSVTLLGKPRTIQDMLKSDEAGD